MVKHAKKERRKTDRFIQIKDWEYKSPAYKALSGDQVKIYLDMLSCYNGRNNGQIVYSSRRGGELIGKSHSTAARAITRLSQLGFIKVTKKYVFAQKRMAREYELTAIGVEPATKSNRRPDGSKDFMRWKQTDIDCLNE